MDTKMNRAGRRSQMICLIDRLTEETDYAGGLDIIGLSVVFDLPQDKSRQIARLLEHQRILENRDGFWRVAATGAVWATVAEETWMAEARGETDRVEIDYETILRHPRSDRFSSRELMHGVNSGQGKEILHYVARSRSVHLGVYDPTMEITG